jgi:hypothetical protein
MARDATTCQWTPSKHPRFPVYCHLPFILPTNPPWMVSSRSPLLLRIQDYLVESPCWKTNSRAGEFSQNPPLLPDSNGPKTADLDVLETLLWLAVESLCQNTGFLVPEEVRCLVPPHMNYLDIQPAKRPVSPKYPEYCRQCRLSYALPAILESTNLGANMMQTWLNTPSTRARLATVLGRLEHINDTLLGSSQCE